MQTPGYFLRKFHPLAILLLPFSLIFAILSAMRRLLYRAGFKRTHRFSVPVIVVGNITVGGTGKTPLVIWLVNFLKTQGYRPGVIMRGYKGSADTWPQLVDAESDSKSVGDEALVIARGTRMPVVVDPDRPRAVRELLNKFDVNIVISDDGLQHYSLGRDLEIIVVDAINGLGNGFLLPAGPLREGKWRLNTADFVVYNGDRKASDCFMIYQRAGKLVNLLTAEEKDLSAWKQESVHAVAGLGNPQRFFDMLAMAGVIVTQHVFPDHHHYSKHDITFADNRPIVMTEKDAVKCQSFAHEGCWYLALEVEVDASFSDAIAQAVALQKK